MEEILSKHWHHIGQDEIHELLGSNPDYGLDHYEVEHRKITFGSNKITPPKKRNPIINFILQFNQALIYILLSASAVTLAIGEYIDSAVIFGVVLVNAIVGFIQEARAINAIESLSRSLRIDSSIIREGKRMVIPAADLVPGDIVFIKSGDRVPADMRILECRNLKIDESSLTGESVPVEKNSETLEAETILPERKNMAYTSGFVTYGTGKAVVISTGDKTEIGQISRLITSTKKIETPLIKQINRFSHVLLVAILALSVLTFIAGILRGQSVIEMFIAAIAMAVGAIPEGLPAALTIILAIGVSRMAEKNAIIRSLPAVETLGSTTVICSDKTGTLTQNQMTVQKICTAGEIFEITGTGYSTDGEIMQGKTALPNIGDLPHLNETLKAGLLCNDSTIKRKDEKCAVEGDPTEGALIISAAKAGIRRKDLLKKFKLVDVLPFESQTQYMASLYEESNGGYVIYAKGSFEKIIEMCESQLNKNAEKSLFNEKSARQEMEAMAREGMRIIALASVHIQYSENWQNNLIKGMTFLGIQGIIDPPRPEIADAISLCHSAGIKVKMITGDHAITASAIAEKINLKGNDTCCSLEAVTGGELSAMNDNELLNIVNNAAVFARVTPEQKLLLVESLQDNGHIVAMTGDGVNDAPALKQANIGISMGLNGTEVARESSDMVLTDDNFATIVAAVREGRSIFDNITKFIIWTLPTNLGEGLVILTAIIFGTILPILPIHILWINMTTALCLGLMLAFEPEEDGIMNRPPRKQGNSFLTKNLLHRMIIVASIQLAGAFGLYKLAVSEGLSITQARTISVNVFVIIELFYLLNCRTLKTSFFRISHLSNPMIYAGSAVMILLQIIITYVPFMNTIFNTAPVTLSWWFIIFSVGLIVLFTVELHKKISRNIY